MLYRFRPVAMFADDLEDPLGPEELRLVADFCEVVSRARRFFGRMQPDGVGGAADLPGNGGAVAYL